jgi:hypothetical protein
MARAMTGAETEMVAIELIDAAELAVTCQFVNHWMRDAPVAVMASLRAFGGPDAPAVVVEALGRLAEVLVRAVPSTTPHGVTTTTPLSPGEALGLAELLVELSVDGWPADTEPARWMADDCQRWAVRLLHTPGVGQTPTGEPLRDHVEARCRLWRGGRAGPDAEHGDAVADSQILTRRGPGR